MKIKDQNLSKTSNYPIIVFLMGKWLNFLIEIYGDSTFYYKKLWIHYFISIWVVFPLPSNVLNEWCALLIAFQRKILISKRDSLIAYAVSNFRSDFIQMRNMEMFRLHFPQNLITVKVKPRVKQ